MASYQYFNMKENFFLQTNENIPFNLHLKIENGLHDVISILLCYTIICSILKQQLVQTLLV